MRIEAANAENGFFPKDKRQKLFANLESLYKLHSADLLPALQDRLAKWEKEEKISDVIVTRADYLKMYSEYTNNYKRAVKIFVECMKKHKKFTSIVHEIEVSLRARINRLRLQSAPYIYSFVKRVPL